MKDFELLRDEIAEREERLPKDPVLEMLVEMPEHSLFRDCKTEDALASSIATQMAGLVRVGVMTQELVNRYLDFFLRHGLPTDVDDVLMARDMEIARDLAEDQDAYAPRPEKQMADRLAEVRRDNRKTMGATLRRIREERQLSIRDVEERTGISKNIICRTEAGRSNTTIDTIAVLADCYGLRIGFFDTADEIGLAD